jgi:hypothetical protein
VLYYYVVPAQVSGTWQARFPASISPGPSVLDIKQDVETLEGRARIGSSSHTLRDPVVRGEKLRFGLLAAGRLLAFTGTVSGGTIEGEVIASGSTVPERWSARRISPAL